MGPSAARVRAVRALGGQLPAQTVEMYRSAGALVRRELEDAQRLRRELLGARTSARHFPPAAAGRLLCVWNAYVLQTVGEYLMDAVQHPPDATVRAGTDQILAFVGPVDRWLSQARHAATDLAYRVEKHVHLPVDPPAWLDHEHDPHSLSAAMVSALRAIHAKGCAVLADYARSPVGRGDDLERVRSTLDRAAVAIDYAVQARHDGVDVSSALHLRYALRLLFVFGQLAAMPALLDVDDRVSVVSLVAHVPARIDPWCLTDPNQRMAWRSLPSAGAAIDRMWAADSCAMATVRVQAQIDAALRSGAILFAIDRTGERLGSFHRCPWPAVYEVRRAVTIGGTHLLPMQHFTLDVLGDGYRDGAPYARRIIVSVFVPADPVVDTAANEQWV
jgi:hypothetical protein